ncbi:MAG: hypothetical protein HOM80_15535, partial [Bacteroidetes bacterium]|nr:hypothetical protein [Bacteroidota bacterium]
MKRINILFILIILLAFSQFSYSQTPPSFDWMRHAGGTDYDDGWGVGTDANGNVYVTGGFKYSATFGSTTITSYGGRDMFLAKYNPNGNLVWLKHGGSSIDNDRGRAIATNAAGFSAVAGYFYVNGTFGNINLVGNGDYDVFIAVYNPNGNCIWANAIGGPYYEEETYGVCIDDNSNVYITGMFMGTINVAQGTTLTSYGGYDAFVIKFNSSGNFQWAKKIGGTSDDIGYDIIADSNGDVCVTGGFEYSATFETGTTITGNGGDDIFLAKYDTNGNLIWAKNAGGTNYETAKGITVDNSDNFYIAGYYAGTATFDTATITSHIAMYSTSYSQDVFIAKYNNSGDLIWLQTAGGQRDNWANGIAVDALGNVSIAGVMEGDMYFGTYFLENNAPGVNFAYEDPFIAHYDSQGNFVWAMHGGAGYHDEAQDICVDPSGNIIATGNLHAATGDLPHFNDVYFPGVLGTNNEEIFVIKIDNAVNLPLTLTSQITNPTCYGISDGSIEITVSGGTPTYTYFWSAGGQTTEDISNLAEGIYNITVSDASGDYLIDTIELIQPSSLVHSFTTSDVTVYGGNDGSID